MLIELPDLQKRCYLSDEGGGCDEIWVRERDTVNTNFMEGVLFVVSTGFAPGSIYGLTLFYVHGFFAVCAILDPVRSLVRSLF
jgi:hypothetical protein